MVVDLVVDLVVVVAEEAEEEEVDLEAEVVAEVLEVSNLLRPIVKNQLKLFLGLQGAATIECWM